ncbi:MAG TPA: VanZ family protein [Burkholderiales bacterium]|nr:VanZ family protein [Burkholderiales bacterium]
MKRSDMSDSYPIRNRYRPSGTTLAWTLALAYTLLIVYASLQPFLGWRLPPAEILHFVTAPWPPYVTLGDLLINTAAYVPLGFLLAIALNPGRSALRAVLAAAALAALLSLTMEAIQMFLPQRVASNVDLLTNSAGGLVGAMAAPLLSPSGFPGRRIAAWRQRLFVPGALTDTGLVLAGLWLFTHLHPTAQLFGTGNLRSTFDLPIYLIHTPGRLLSAEAVIVFFNLIGLGLLVACLTRHTAQPLRIVTAVVGAGLVVKIIAAVALFGAPGPLVWLTPGVALGLTVGALLLYPLVRLPRTHKMIMALLSFCAAVAVINFAPDNPYQSAPPKLIPGNATHLLRFSNIVRALSELWPFLVIGFLLAAAAIDRARTGRGAG